MIPHDRTWIEISSTAVRHNFRVFQRLVGSRVGIMPILKANAYGHGWRELATILRVTKPTALGVAYGEEALQLRAAKYRGRIVVLSNWHSRQLPELVKNHIELVVWDWPSYRALWSYARQSKRRSKVHLKLDTGTTRIGFTASDIPKLQKALKIQDSFIVVGLFSHLANAEEQSTTRTKAQLKRFATLDKQLDLDSRVGRHIACTAAILRYPEARFGLIRLGIGLYGLWPSNEIKAWSRAHYPKLRLEPALAWYTQLAQVKRVPPGTGIGYGSTFKAKKAMRVGILPVGYADGYDRRLSNTGHVMIRGRRAPVIGRVCMNLMMVDLTKITSAIAGDRVTLIGPGVTADELAGQSGTINYELVTRINWSLPRYIVSSYT